MVGRRSAVGRNCWGTGAAGSVVDVLAALLIGEWDVIALDEPVSNHLDVEEGIAWLAGHLTFEVKNLKFLKQELLIIDPKHKARSTAICTITRFCNLRKLHLL